LTQNPSGNCGGQRLEGGVVAGRMRVDGGGP